MTSNNLVEPSRPLPVAEARNGLQVLRGLLRERSLLAALALMREYVGPVFQITMPRFRPAVFVGPDSNRQVLVTERGLLSWRNETDPVVKLLRRGVLVVDGEEHDRYRHIMDAPYQRRNVLPSIPAFWRYTDDVTATWEDGSTQDMLVEMRKLALLMLMGASFHVDVAPDIDRLWQPILDLMQTLPTFVYLIPAVAFFSIGKPPGGPPAPLPVVGKVWGSIGVWFGRHHGIPGSGSDLTSINVREWGRHDNLEA